MKDRLLNIREFIRKMPNGGLLSLAPYSCGALLNTPLLKGLENNPSPEAIGAIIGATGGFIFNAGCSILIGLKDDDPATRTIQGFLIGWGTVGGAILGLLGGHFIK